jgi:hypothetical protein
MSGGAKPTNRTGRTSVVQQFRLVTNLVVDEKIHQRTLDGLSRRAVRKSIPISKAGGSVAERPRTEIDQ